MAIETTLDEAREMWDELCKARQAARDARANMQAAVDHVEKVGNAADLKWAEASVARDVAVRVFFTAAEDAKSAEAAWALVCESVEEHMCHA